MHQCSKSGMNKEINSFVHYWVENQLINSDFSYIFIPNVGVYISHTFSCQSPEIYTRQYTFVPTTERAPTSMTNCFTSPNMA